MDFNNKIGSLKGVTLHNVKWGRGRGGGGGVFCPLKPTFCVQTSSSRNIIQLGDQYCFHPPPLQVSWAYLADQRCVQRPRLPFTCLPSYLLYIMLTLQAYDPPIYLSISSDVHSWIHLYSYHCLPLLYIYLAPSPLQQVFAPLQSLHLFM